MRRWICGLLLMAVLVGAATAMAQERMPTPAKTGEQTSAVNPGCGCATPPVYIEDWTKLAEFTRSDPLVFARADRWAERRHNAGSKLGFFGVMGGGIALGSIYRRLFNDHWTDGTRWGLISGISLSLVTLAASLVILPSRDDFLDVVNQWNARHPDRQVVP